MICEKNTTWTEINRLILVPITDIVALDDLVAGFLSSIKEFNMSDPVVNHNWWRTLEHLCRQMRLAKGDGIRTAPFIGRYQVSDLTLYARDPDGRGIQYPLVLTVKGDVCVWTNSRMMGENNVETVVCWHHSTNTLTSVSIIDGEGVFGGRSWEYDRIRDGHFEDILENLVKDVFDSLVIEGYVGDADFQFCRWGLRDDN